MEGSMVAAEASTVAGAVFMAEEGSADFTVVAEEDLADFMVEVAASADSMEEGLAAFTAAASAGGAECIAADLIEADLIEADLIEADLIEADLEGRVTLAGSAASDPVCTRVASMVDRGPAVSAPGRMALP